jgi:hypothetical protein
MTHPFEKRGTLVDIPVGDISVMVGIPTCRDFHPLTVKSLIGTFAACRERNIACELGLVSGMGIIEWARDEVVDLFLKSKATRLFWIDSDMVWEPAQFIRLLALSGLVDVLAATYPAKREPPTFYVNRDVDKPVEPDALGLIEVWGTGLGFCVMRRVVVEKLAARAERVRDQVNGQEIASVFRVDRHNQDRRGEDMAFFSDIRALGYKVLLDPSVDLGHIGTKLYTGSIRDALRVG